MGLFRQKLNPISGQFNLVPTGTIITFKDGVANAAALPSSGNTLNDARITNDTGHLYVWSGTTWVDQGDVINLTWSAIDGKPTSSVANIDDAVYKKHSNSLDHAQGTDQGLDTGGTNAVTAAQAKTGYSHSQVAHAPSDAVSLATVKADTDIDNAIDNTHAPHSDDQVIPDQLSDLSDDATHRLVTDTEKSTWNDITDVALNVMLNAFRIAQIESLTIFNMVKGFMDEYEDESGVDVANCINQVYNSSGDYYNPSFGLYDSNTKTLLHFDVSPLIDSANTPGTVTVYGSAVRNVSTPKFESGCLECTNPSTDYVSISGNFSIASKIFTLESWVRLSVVDNVLLFNTPPAGSGDFQVYLNPTSIYFPYYSDSGWAALSSASFSTLSANTWYHLVIAGDGTNCYFFLNGQLIGTPQAFPFNPYPNSGLSPLKIGQGVSKTNTVLFDEFRWSNVCRWTSTFSIPTEAYKSPVGNMTLKSNVNVATIVPTSARIVLFEEDVDSVTINTDLKAYVSRNNGTTYSQVTLEDEGNYITGARILSGVVDISGQPSGSNMKYKIETLNSKNLKLHGTSVSWKA